MGIAGVFTILMGFFLSWLLFMNSPVLAANATALDITAPSGVDINDDFTVTAAYSSNGTDLCDATCMLDGGWLGGYIHLSETPGCEYSALIQAPGYSGSHTLHVYCVKAGYDSQPGDFDIDIEMEGARLSVVFKPQSPYPGDTLIVDAFYEDGSGNLIYGQCNAKLRENSVEIKDTYMPRYGGVEDYYRGEFILPQGTADYSVRVTCTSNQHETERKTVSFMTRKKQAYLSLKYPKVVYYGQDVKINAEYAHTGGMISGTCILSFDGAEKQIDYSYMGYDGIVRIPYAAGKYNIGVTCSSVDYETAEKSIVMTPVRRSSTIIVGSPVKTVFYPTDNVSFEIFYVDFLTGKSITNAKCFLDGSRELETEDGMHMADAGNLKVGQHEFYIKCSEQFYEETIKTFTVDVVRIPVDVKLVEDGSEYKTGEDIEIKASVVDISENDANVSCKARVDSYDLLFNNLLDYYTADMTPKDGMHSLTVPNPGKPIKLIITVTCSGDVYEEETARTEFVTKQLSRKTEEGAILLLSVMSVVLVAFTLLIRKKLKLI